MQRTTVAPLIPVSLGVCAVATALLVTRATADPEYETTTMVLESPEHSAELCLGGVLTSLPRGAEGCRSRTGIGTPSTTKSQRTGRRGCLYTCAGHRTARPSRSPDRPAVRVRRMKIHRPSILPAHAPTLSTQRKASQGGRQRTKYDGGTFSDIPGLVAIWVTDRPRAQPKVFVANLVVRPGLAEATKARVRRHYRGPLCIVERDQRTAASLAADFARLDDVLTSPFLTAGVDERRGVIRSSWPSSMIARCARLTRHSARASSS